MYYLIERRFHLLAKYEKKAKQIIYRLSENRTAISRKCECPEWDLKPVLILFDFILFYVVSFFMHTDVHFV
jgi:hypothetical protein